MSTSIPFLDKTFWITESEDNPKHVASLQLLDMPEGAGEDYIETLVAKLRTFDTAVAPLNYRVKSIFRYPLKFVPVDKLDMDYHVQLKEVDDVADMQALHEVVARLHEPCLERDKPLWQFTVIKGKQGSRFAVYVKIHHMLGDGATMVRWFQAGYSPEPHIDDFMPVWAMERKKRSRPKQNPVTQFFKGLYDFVIATFDLFWILFRLLLKLVRINPVYMPVPFSGTKTLLTGQVKRGRCVATTDMDFDRIQKVGKRLRATVNEVLLCCFDIGVHRFLKDHGHTFDKALYTNMPINLRKPGEQTGGNKIAIVPVMLAHGKSDPYLRLRQIIENHRIVKRAAKRSHPGAFSYYTVLIQTFALVFEMFRASALFRPIANILISNVPGPKDTRYFRDAKLLALYPISTIVPGGGVNITLLTYGNKANVGIVCCDTKIKSLENMAMYFNDAFDLLEKSIEDHEVSVEDIGERTTTPATLVDDDPYKHDHHHDEEHERTLDKVENQ
ncbi:MAG: wax ester/triacylglycerol synthase domain-containing protein [Aestuariibacter sp.]